MIEATASGGIKPANRSARPSRRGHETERVIAFARIGTAGPAPNRYDPTRRCRRHRRCFCIGVTKVRPAALNSFASFALPIVRRDSMECHRERARSRPRPVHSPRARRREGCSLRIRHHRPVPGLAYDDAPVGAKANLDDFVVGFESGEPRRRLILPRIVGLIPPDKDTSVSAPVLVSPQATWRLRRRRSQERRPVCRRRYLHRQRKDVRDPTREW